MIFISLDFSRFCEYNFTWFCFGLETCGICFLSFDSSSNSDNELFNEIEVKIG